MFLIFEPWFKGQDRHLPVELRVQDNEAAGLQMYLQDTEVFILPLFYSIIQRLN